MLSHVKISLIRAREEQLKTGTFFYDKEFVALNIVTLELVQILVSELKTDQLIDKERALENQNLWSILWILIDQVCEREICKRMSSISGLG